MKKGVWIVLGIVAFVLVAGFFFLTKDKGDTTSSGQTSTPSASSELIKCNDMQCIGQNFNSCTPAESTISVNGQSIIITIRGFEKGKCHYTMVFGNVTAANCYFKEEDLNDKVLNQMFGNDEGQAAVLTESCWQTAP